MNLVSDGLYQQSILRCWLVRVEEVGSLLRFFLEYRLNKLSHPHENLFIEEKRKQKIGN